MPSSQVSLLLEPLSEADYQSLLYASDIVLMPYNEKEYRVRGSTVVSEAIAAAKTIIARTGAYPAKAAERHGGISGLHPIDMAKGILTIASNRTSYATQAKRISADYIEKNGIETYWPKCLAKEKEAEQKRVASVGDVS